MPVVVEGVPQGCGLNLSVLGLASWPEVGLGTAAELREPSSPPRDLPVAWVPALAGGFLGGLGAGELLGCLQPPGFTNSARCCVEIITLQSRQHHTQPGAAAGLQGALRSGAGCVLSGALGRAQITG